MTAIIIAGLQWKHHGLVDFEHKDNWVIVRHKIFRVSLSEKTK